MAFFKSVGETFKRVSIRECRFKSFQWFHCNEQQPRQRTSRDQDRSVHVQ